MKKCCACSRELHTVEGVTSNPCSVCWALLIRGKQPVRVIVDDMRKEDREYLVRRNGA